MGTSKLSGKPDEMLGGYLRRTRGIATPPGRDASRFMLRKPG